MFIDRQNLEISELQEELKEVKAGDEKKTITIKTLQGLVNTLSGVF